MQENQIQWLP